jgi:hypothetical protein
MALSLMNERIPTVAPPSHAGPEAVRVGQDTIVPVVMPVSRATRQDWRYAAEAWSKAAHAAKKKDAVGVLFLDLPTFAADDPLYRSRQVRRERRT